MATFDTFRAPAVIASPRALFTAIVSAFTEWNDRRATVKALNALTDRELEDVGLCRADIDSFPIRG